MSSLQAERNQLFADIWEGRKPKRVPVTAMISLEYAIQHQGYSLFREYYSAKHCFEVAEEMAKLINSDTLPTHPENSAAAFRYSLSKFMVQGRDGFYQHPNYSPMKFEEYPDFIKDPFEYWANVVRPRIFGILEEDERYGELRLNIARNVVASKSWGMGTPQLVEKYERSNIEAMAMMSCEPLDYIADFLRNFSDICIDMRRAPEWVCDAAEAMLQFSCDSLDRVTKVPGKINKVTLPLHMAPFLNAKNFEKFYFPTFKKLIEAIQERGLHASIYCEHDWTPHLEALNDLPGRVEIGFEMADPKLVVEKLDKRHIISTFFKTHMLRTATPEQVSDEVKRLLDIVAVNGNYIFAMNKPVLNPGDAKIENIQAMVDTAVEYGVY
ncbi:MAG TPA: uroporphyrinogen decarboxylase family protein [Oscillospiraceae bacterium]|nr:uroporphyrinogen decarboxylase family protein [Oscillospiraceae bacterium]